jgi:3'(2'), 5'-bisphosphate nucleotidase
VIGTTDFTESTLLDELALIVSRAGAAIMQARRSTLAARRKPDLSPVTKADDDAEEIILEGLSRILPGVAVVSEEAFPRGVPPRLGHAFVLVDPLDGTRELLAGRDEFTVNLAIVSAGRPALGVIAAPALNMMWRAHVAQAAERLYLPPGAAPEAAREREIIRTRSWPAHGVRALVSRSHLDPATEKFVAQWPDAERIACGSSLKFCRLAEGAADVYPRLSTTSEWDIAAGEALLVAAGGVVRNPDGALPEYGRADGDFRVPAFIAWGDPAGMLQSANR